MTTEYFDLSVADFSQNWTTTSLITADDNWSGVQSIVGYRGDGLAGATGVDPQTVTGTSAVVDVIANQANPNTNNAGGVAEFQILDPVVALQGSGTARAPYIVVHLNATGRQNLHLDFDARDIDGAADNSVQPLAVQYRIGDAGPWVNIPSGFISDASSGPSQATLVTHRSIDLPAAVNGQPQVQVRFITTDAVGSDEWIGIDNIVIASEAQGATPPTVSIGDVTLVEGDGGVTNFVFTVTRSGGADAFSVAYATADGTAAAGSDFTAAAGTLDFALGENSKTVTVAVSGDTTVEDTETFFVNLSAPTNGAVLGDGQGVGTIINDDTAAPPSVSISDVTVAEGNAGATSATFTITRTGGTGAFTVDYATADGVAAAGSDYTGVGATTLSFAAGQLSQTVTVQVSGDTAIEPNETFFVNLSNATGGATIGDGQGQGTITNDDVVLVTGTPWINEFHYDNVSDDVGEFIEIAGPAGLNLTGYSLVLYNGSSGAGVSYNTIQLSGAVPSNIIPNQSNGYGTVRVNLPRDGLQNGTNDAIALVGPGGNVIEFLGYEGVITASNGPAAGMTSTDVGVAELGPPAGGSIARTGSGFEGSDFTWVLTTDDTPGVVNAGQTFIEATTRVRVSDPTVMEGNSGTTVLTFNVTRSGPTQAFSVDYATANGTATAGPDYTSASGTLSFAEGQTSATVQVTVFGDLTAEPTETVLLNLTNATNGANIFDGQGVGSIVNDDLLTLKTYEIQGQSHTSAYAGQTVITSGVVTVIDTNGFWIQDQAGDGNVNTSDGLFVFTSAVPTVTLNQLVQVTGAVTEFGTGNNLTITQINGPMIAVLGTGSITATILGQGGRQVPTEVVDNDGRTVYDPATDAMDFFESLEGMLVVVPNAQVTDISNGNTFWVVADQGANASGLNDRGGITIGAGDFNPERIEIFRDSGILPGFSPSFDMGDRVGDITGVVSYFNGDYEVVLTNIQVTTAPGSPPDDVSTLDGDATHLTIAAYNLENIDPGDPDAKFQALAVDIVTALKTPDIIGVEEIQDADGAGAGPDRSGQATAQKLIDAIVAAGGPTYSYVEVIPTGNVGGEPGGNIRNGFLYDASRVTYVAGSARAVTGDAYNGSRQPVAADFMFRGETITAIDVHSTSRIGSDAGIFGVNQPPLNAGEGARIAQSQGVRDFVLALQAANPSAHIAVMGDFNGFQFEHSLTLLEQGGSLANLATLLPADERYSYVFDGNSQQIDHMLVSQGLFASAEFDIVHRNTGQAGFRPTDHDAVLARFLINTGPTATADTAAVNEDATVLINVLANDNDPNTGDTKTIVSVSATAKGASVSIVGGQVQYVANADSFDLLNAGQSTTDSFSYVMRDAAGATSTATVQVTVNGLANAPTQVGGAGADTLTGTSGDERIEGNAGNDRLLGGEGADSVIGGLGNDVIFGEAGIDSLSGADGADTVVGGVGDDTLALGRGADLLVFQGAFGDDLILDFKSGEDDARFENAGFLSFSDFIAHASQVGTATVVTNDLGHSVTFANTQIASLQSADFLFVNGT